MESAPTCQAGIGRTVVQYWESAFQIDPYGWAVQRMARALGWDLTYFGMGNAHAHDAMISIRAKMEADIVAGSPLIRPARRKPKPGVPQPAVLSMKPRSAKARPAG